MTFNKFYVGSVLSALIGVAYGAMPDKAWWVAGVFGMALGVFVTLWWHFNIRVERAE